MTLDLDADLLAAHASGDAQALIALYTQAGHAAAGIDAKCFYWTHAYVFALEAGDARATDLHHLLKSEGREA